MEIKRIAPEQAKDLLDSNQGYIYLDVRTVPELEAGHVPGAKNVPVVEPDASGRMQRNPRFVEIVEANFAKDVKCITGCQKGGRSMRLDWRSTIESHGGGRGAPEYVPTSLHEAAKMNKGRTGKR